MEKVLSQSSTNVDNVQLKASSAQASQNAAHVSESLFIKQFNLWASKFKSLIKENTLVFTLVENFRMYSLVPSQLIVYLKELKLFGPTVCVMQLPNPKFVYIKFSSRDEVNKFVEATQFLETKRVKYITGKESVRSVMILIDRIPMDILIDSLPIQLQQWGTIVNMVPAVISKDDGPDCQLGRVRVDFVLGDNVALEDLPYFVRLLDMKIYIHIRGRPRICFRCGDTSHLVGSCPKKYCSFCRCIMPKLHGCRVTYAQRLLGSGSRDLASLEKLLEDENLVHLQVTADPDLDLPNVSDGIGLPLLDRESAPIPVAMDTFKMCDQAPMGPVEAQSSSPLVAKLSDVHNSTPVYNAQMKSVVPVVLVDAIADNVPPDLSSVDGIMDDAQNLLGKKNKAYGNGSQSTGLRKKRRNEGSGDQPKQVVSKSYFLHNREPRDVVVNNDLLSDRQDSPAAVSFDDVEVEPLSNFPSSSMENVSVDAKEVDEVVLSSVEASDSSDACD